MAAVGALAVQRLNFANSATGHFFNLAARLDERHAQILGQHLPQGRFARATQAHQGGKSAGCVTCTRTPTIACALASTGARSQTQKIAQRALQRLSHRQQDQDGDVAQAIFHVGQVALRHARGLR